MIIARIKDATRVLGKAQGYLGLPIRDELRNTTVDGEQTQRRRDWRPLISEER